MSAQAERNREIVATMIANGLAGRYDIIRQYIADDYECHLPAGLPYGGEYQGWDGYTQVFTKIVDFFSDVAFGPNQFLPDDEKVVVLSRVKGTLRKSGKKIDMPLIEVWRLRKEMITSITAYYFDTKMICDLNNA
jgi:ketosteroid isomerase-like protein